MVIFHKTYKNQFDNNPNWKPQGERWVVKLVGPFRIRKGIRSYFNKTSGQYVQEVIEKTVWIGKKH